MIPNNVMNNPLMLILQAGRNGGSPMQVMQQIAGQNPMAAQAMQMMKGKNPQQLRQMAENMAKEKGISLPQFAQQFGFNLPR